jgi:hypothetical protein
MELLFNDLLIIPTKVQRLDKIHNSLHRLELEPSDYLPRTVVVKQQKDGWKEEFENEQKVYERLEKLQGIVIPRYFGQGLFNQVPALILSEVAGTTLLELARSNRDIQEEILETQITKALHAFTKFGAVYWDQRLDNFLLCDMGQNSGVMIVDLEEVAFPDKPRPWEKQLNRAGVSSLMSDFRSVRDPNRPPTPIDWQSIRERSGQVVSCSYSLSESSD